MSSEPVVSIIFTVKNNGIDLFMTLESLKVSRTDYDYEVIIVNEDSVDGCCDFLMNYTFPWPLRLVKGREGLPSRNLGAVHAGGTYLIFASPHLYFMDDWMELLLEPLITEKVDGVSPGFTVHEHAKWKPDFRYEGGFLQSVYNYPLTLANDTLAWLSGDCFAINRAKFQEIGGMEEGFGGRELEAAELSLRIWLMGGNCRFISQVVLIQVYRPNFPCDDKVSKWGEDLLTLAYLHFNDDGIQICRERITRIFGPDGCRNESGILQATTLAREKYKSRRIHDDSWFLNGFGISL